MDASFERAEIPDFAPQAIREKRDFLKLPLIPDGSFSSSANLSGSEDDTLSD